MKKKILSLMLSLAVSMQCLCFTVNAETDTDSTDSIRTIAIDLSDKNAVKIELFEGEQIQLVLPHDPDEYKVNYVNYYSEDNHIAVSQDLKVVGCYAGKDRDSIYVGYEFDPYYRDEIKIIATVKPNENISAENRAELDRLNGFRLTDYRRRKLELVGAIDENAPRLTMDKIQEFLDGHENNFENYFELMAYDGYYDIISDVNNYVGYPDVVSGSGNTSYTYWFDSKGSESISIGIDTRYVAYTKIADDGTIIGVQGLYPEKTEFFENGKDKDYYYMQYNQTQPKPEGYGTLNMKFIDGSTGESFTETNGKFQLLTDDDEIIKSWDASEGSEITIGDLSVDCTYELRYIDDYHGEFPDEYRYEIDHTKGTSRFSFAYDTEISCNVYLRKRNWSDPRAFYDVNCDDSFNIADVVTLQKWLLGKPNVVLMNWQAADLCMDGKLDMFDLCLMKKELVKSLSN